VTDEHPLDLDLDELRAARSEADKATRSVQFGGERFEFPVRMPLEFGDLLNAGRFGAAFRALLGDADGDRFLAHRPDDLDLQVLSERLYGVEQGEALASSSSSNGTSRRSRPTSNGSIRSTSPKRAGAPKR
jgi:hypothetical protein